MAPAAAPPRCAVHGRQPAGWRCQACGATLCPDCTFTHQVGAASLAACGRCRGLAEPLTRRRADRLGYALRLPAALAFPVAEGGWKVLLASALVFRLFSWFGGLAALLGFGLRWGLYLSVIRHTAHDGAPLETPEYSDLWGDVARPALSALLGMALVLVPAVAWLGSTHELPELAAGAWLTDPVAWLLVLVGVIWAPAALMAAAMSRSLLSTLDPRVPIALMARLGGDYALLVAATLGAVVLDVLAGVAGRLVGALPVPVAAGVAAEALGLWAPLCFARAAGLLLHVRGDELGYGLAQDYLEPLLPGAEPRGSPPPEAGATRRLQEIELPPEPAPEPASPAAAVPATPSAPPRDAAALFEEARAAAAAGRFDEAAGLLRAAAEDEDHPVAASAWLVLARLYRNRLGHPEAARQALTYLVARWPDGEAARQARALLAG